MISNLTSLSVNAIAAGIRARKITAKEVTLAYLAKIEKLNGQINAFITINPSAAKEAEAIDAAIAQGDDPGLLAGVPVGIKDLICTHGIKTTAGSKMLTGFIPPYSATLVRRLKGHGAVVLGKTNLDEFAMGSSNETSAFGPVKNPWNLNYSPGGSSGGSAAALAAEMAPLTVGTDTGGSIRQPSSFCGVFGLKPTYGRISRYGIISYASSLDQAGPMARSTGDVALGLQVMSGKCQNDSTSANEKVPEWFAKLNEQIKGRRIGIPKEYFSSSLESDTARAMANAIELLRKLGAVPVDVSLSLVKYSIPTYYLVATSEAASNLARYDGIRYGHRTSDAGISDLDQMYKKSRGEGFGSEVKRRIILGTFALSSGYYDAYYQKASQVRRLIQQELLFALTQCDIIVAPVTRSPAFELGRKTSNPVDVYMNDMLTTSANLAGLPAMSVPFALSSKQLPIGVQLIARHFDEQTILDFAYAIEKNHPLEKKAPNV